MATRRDEITTTTTKTPIPGPVRWWLLLVGLLVTMVLLTWGFVSTVHGATADQAREALDAADLTGVEVSGGTYRDLELTGPAADEAAALAAVEGIDLPYDVTYVAYSPVGGDADVAATPEADDEADATQAAQPSVIPEPEPEPEVVEIADLPDLSQIQFETGSSTLTADSAATLDAAAQAILAAYEDRPALAVAIEGHTDGEGDDDLNMTISQQRADAVRDYLQGAGVPDQILTATGFGETRPIADNGTAEGRALNRRVDFIITEG